MSTLASSLICHRTVHGSSVTVHSDLLFEWISLIRVYEHTHNRTQYKRATNVPQTRANRVRYTRSVCLGFVSTFHM